jgi:hypothetical protein
VRLQRKAAGDEETGVESLPQAHQGAQTGLQEAWSTMQSPATPPAPDGIVFPRGFFFDANRSWRVSHPEIAALARLALLLWRGLRPTKRWVEVSGRALTRPPSIFFSHHFCSVLRLVKLR